RAPPPRPWPKRSACSQHRSRSSPPTNRAPTPGSNPIWRTIVLAHMRLGILGGIVAGLVFALLWMLDVPFISRSPQAAGLVMVGFGIVAGLFLGGLVALRPDHDRYIQATH